MAGYILLHLLPENMFIIPNLISKCQEQVQFFIYTLLGVSIIYFPPQFVEYP